MHSLWTAPAGTTFERARMTSQIHNIRTLLWNRCGMLLTCCIIICFDINMEIRLRLHQGELLSCVQLLSLLWFY